MDRPRESRSGDPVNSRENRMCGQSVNLARFMASLPLL